MTLFLVSRRCVFIPISLPANYSYHNDTRIYRHMSPQLSATGTSILDHANVLNTVLIYFYLQGCIYPHTDNQLRTCTASFEVGCSERCELILE